MTPPLTEALLWLFVIDLGIALGAGLYEHRVMFPEWFHHDDSGGISVHGEVMRRVDSGRRFWAFVTTLPLTLLTLISLVAAWQSRGSLREWWLTAAVITLIERVGTFFYFIPTAMKLMSAETLPHSRAGAMAASWKQLNVVRIALNFAGLLAALQAFSWLKG